MPCGRRKSSKNMSVIGESANSHRNQSRLFRNGGSSVPNIALTFASGPYDRMQALREGAIRPTGIDLTYLTMQPAEIFWRMLQYKEFDISEMSMSNYLMAASTKIGRKVFYELNDLQEWIDRGKIRSFTGRLNLHAATASDGNAADRRRTMPALSEQRSWSGATGNCGARPGH